MSKKVKIIISFLLLFVLLGSTTPEVFAEPGEFYERNKEKFEGRFPLSTDYIGLVKKYDFETNTFDCGRFIDFYCKLKGPLFSANLGLVQTAFATSADVAVVQPNQIINNPVFHIYRVSLQRLSIWMLAIFIMWHLIKVVAYRFADPEDGMIALNDTILKFVPLAIFLALYNQIFEFILNFQAFAVEAIVSQPVSLEEVAVTIFLYGGRFGMLLASVISVFMFIFYIAYLYRFTLFGLLYITGVIAIPTGMNDEYNYFGLWLRLLISNGVTLFLQALCYAIGLNALFVQNAFNRGNSITIAIAFWVLALTVPSLLGQLGARTGTGGAIGSVVRVVARRVGRR